MNIDYIESYELLKKLLHQKGLFCGNCNIPIGSDQAPHKFSSTNLPSFKCKKCGSVFNIFTNTVFQGIHYNCTTIILMLQGIIHQKKINLLSKELNINYKNLLNWQYKLKQYLASNKEFNQVLATGIDDICLCLGGKYSDVDKAPGKFACKKTP